jgi:hypothetical protein
MGNLITRHPGKASAVAGTILLGTYRILQGFDLVGGVWSTISQQPFFIWIKGWLPAMSTSFLTFVLDLSIISLLVWISVAILRYRKEVGWLEALADEDHKMMEQRIVICDESKKAVEVLHPTGPYVILQVPILNSSIYSLTLEEKVENRVTFWGEPFPSEAEILRPDNSEQPIVIKHGETYQLQIRQWITPHVVNFLQQVNDKVEFGVSRVALRFTYLDRAGIRQSVRIFLGRSFFTKGRR